ncbi:MAG: hypothetical protein FMNOHCHN_01937 [Ignavibacteriaceae bacterium]|nr:hypothetical protein [Ignavibacteriaceae bacterium]
MAAEKLLIDKIEHRFSGKPFFEAREIAAFYRMKEKEISPAAINWRIHFLVRSGVFQRIGKGKYVLGKGRSYFPEISGTLKTLFLRVTEEFPYSDVCIWNTSWFNEFMLHQPARFFTIIEISKETSEAAFYFLKDLKKQVFLEPDEEILEKYLSGDREAFVVKPLVTEAPTQIIKGVTTVTLEKMLVDIFCGEDIFAVQQGTELKTIFREALIKYTVNHSKMMRYADRRGKKEQLGRFLKSFSNLRQ